MGNVSVFRLDECKEDYIESFNSYFLSYKNYKYSKFYLNYSREYFSKNYTDSIVIVYDSVVCGYVLIAPIDQDALTCYGDPLQVFWLVSECDESLKYLVSQTVSRYLKRYSKERGYKTISVVGKGPFFSELYRFSDSLSYDLNSVVNLSLSKKDVRRCLRKSYRSLVNWGERELSLEFMDKNHGSVDDFEKYRRLHIEVSRRETRTKESWDKQYHWIKKGYGSLILAKYQGELVSGVMSLYGSQEAYYGVGVTRRDLMADRIPVGHYPLLRAIMKAKEDGRVRYNLGACGPHFITGKDMDIARFKKGYATDLVGLPIYQASID